MSKKRPNKPGPEPERLKIDADWKDSVKKALETPPLKEEHSTDEEHDNDERAEE